MQNVHNMPLRMDTGTKSQKTFVSSVHSVVNDALHQVVPRVNQLLFQFVVALHFGFEGQREGRTSTIAL